MLDFVKILLFTKAVNFQQFQKFIDFCEKKNYRNVNKKHKLIRIARIPTLNHKEMFLRNFEQKRISFK